MCLSIAVFSPPRCTLSSPTCRFAPNLCYCLSVFSLRFSATALSFFHNPLSTPQPQLPPPTFVHPFFSRTLVFPLHTSYEPHGSSVSPVWDHRRRWVMLTVCTETEPVPTCVLSPPFYRNLFSPIFRSLFFSPHIQQHRVPITCRRSHGRKAPSYSSITPFCDPRYVPFTTHIHTVPLRPVREPSRLSFPLFTSYLGFSCGGA